MEITEYRPGVDGMAVAKLYANVFRYEPWNEATRCPDTGKFYGPDTTAGQPCPDPNCDLPLEEAYPIERTAAYIDKEARRAGALALVLKEGDALAGFAWGYTTNLDPFIEEKYRRPGNRGEVRLSLQNNGLNNRDPFFYVSEVGIAVPFRGQGYSNQLFGRLDDLRKEQQLNSLMRTNALSPMVAVADRFGYRQAMGPKVLVDRPCGRLLVLRDVVESLDKENPDRVLFIQTGRH